MGRKILNLKIQIEWLQKLKLLLLIEIKRDKRQAIRNKQQPRMTKKTNMIGNPRQSGSYEPMVKVSLKIQMILLKQQLKKQIFITIQW